MVVGQGALIAWHARCLLVLKWREWSGKPVLYSFLRPEIITESSY